MATRIEAAAGWPSFRQYMDWCLYDPDFGYYGAGKVQFGHQEHFWTFPKQMSPVFGWMVAEVLRRMFDSLRTSDRMPVATPWTVLELGAGDGDLAADVLDYVEQHRSEPPWAPLANRMRYVVGDQSRALRARQRQRLQRHLAAGRAEVRPLDASRLDWRGPFHGVVVANELLCALPCERLRVMSAQDIHRVHVVPAIPRELAREMPLDGCVARAPPGLRRFIPAGHRLAPAASLQSVLRWLSKSRPAHRVQPFFAELAVPLSLGWWENLHQLTAPPPDLLQYLARLEPLFEDLAARQLLPVDLAWSPQMGACIRAISTLLTGPGRRGMALIIDYGGTSRDVLDPQAGPHLRTYGPCRSAAHSPAPYTQPGELDITWDVDFEDAAVLAARGGLELKFFGAQSAIELPPLDLASPPCEARLIRRGIADGLASLADACDSAQAVRQRFRDANGFWSVVFGPRDVPFSLEQSDGGRPSATSGNRTLQQAWLHHQRALQLSRRGRNRAAVAGWQAALRLLRAPERLRGRTDEDRLSCRWIVLLCLAEIWDTRQIRLIEEAHQLLPRLHPDPSSELRRLEEAVCLHKLGVAWAHQGNLSRAREILAAAVALRRRLLERSPTSGSRLFDLASALEDLGAVLLEKKHIRSARQRFDEALGIRCDLLARDPTDRQLRRDATYPLLKIGEARLAAGDVSGASETMLEVLRLRRALANEAPGDRVHRHDLRVALSRMADVRTRQGQLAESRAYRAEAGRIRPRQPTTASVRS